MYIILVKCNDHLFYVTKIIWSVIDTAKDQHKSKQEVHVYLYSEFFPVQMYSFIQKLNITDMKLLTIDS